MHQENNSKKITRVQHGERGFTLFYAVLVSSLLLAIGLAILNITFKEFLLSSGARDSETAFYTADSVLECALYWDRALKPFGYYGDSLAEDLAGYWRFEEDQTIQTDENPYVIDSSGAGVFGAVQNGLLWTPNGEIDQALSFDGVDDRVALNSSVTFEDGEAFSVSLWIKPQMNFAAPYTSTQIILAGNLIINGVPVNGGRFGIVQVVDVNGTTLWYRLKTTDTSNVNRVQTLLDANWHHVVIRRDESNQAEIVVDGGKEILSFGVMPGIFNFEVFGYNTAGNYYFGDLDDVRAYSQALSDDEITALYEKKILAGFVQPKNTGEAPGITCAEDDVNDDKGWWEWEYEIGETTRTGTGWYTHDISTTRDEEVWETFFDVRLPNGTCGRAEVIKNDAGETEIISRGYNTCDLNNPRTLERAIKARY